MKDHVFDKAKIYESKSNYYENKIDEINLSMPESLEYFEDRLIKAKEYHQNLKNGKEKKLHSFSLTYAKKEVNELEKKLKIANILWSEK